MVLAVVHGQSVRIDVWLQRRKRIGKWWKQMFHSGNLCGAKKTTPPLAASVRWKSSTAVT
jgi:hypothetical protein